MQKSQVDGKLSGLYLDHSKLQRKSFGLGRSMPLGAHEKVLTGSFLRVFELHVDPVVKVIEVAASSSPFEVPHGSGVETHQSSKGHGEGHKHSAEASTGVLAGNIIGEAISHGSVVEENHGMGLVSHFDAFFQFPESENSESPKVEFDPIAISIVDEEHQEGRDDSRSLEGEKEDRNGSEFLNQAGHCLRFQKIKELID